ncbi:MAG: hypothetical protein GX764_03645 [Firmicutes bacterium]|nr:hypothetical protein [Bacillota bacterium]
MEKAIIDDEGFVIDDVSCLVIDDETVNNYRVRLRYDDKIAIYTLSHRGFIHLADFNTMNTTTKYYKKSTSSMNFPGIRQCLWHGTSMPDGWVEGASYGVGDEISPGNMAVKIYPGEGLPDGTDIVIVRNVVDIPSDEGIYFTSVKFKAPENITVTHRARLGNQNSSNYIGSGKYSANTVEFDASDKTVKVVGITVGTYTPGQWYDVEYSFDYKNGFLSVWIDGVQYVNNLEVGILGATKHDTYGKQYTPYMAFRTVGENVTENVWFDDYKVMQVATMDYHEVRQSKGLKVYRGSEVAEFLEGGETYTLQNTLGVFAGTACNNFIAVYRMEYEDTSANSLKGVKLVDVKMANALPVSVTLPDTLVEYYPGGERIKSKIILKAMSMSENLEPNGSSITLH